jgi:hypothetical protein
MQQDRQMVANLSKNAVRTWIVRVVFCLYGVYCWITKKMPVVGNRPGRVKSSLASHTNCNRPNNENYVETQTPQS